MDAGAMSHEFTAIGSGVVRAALSRQDVGWHHFNSDLP